MYYERKNIICINAAFGKKKQRNELAIKKGTCYWQIVRYEVRLKAAAQILQRSCHRVDRSRAARTAWRRATRRGRRKRTWRNWSHHGQWKRSTARRLRKKQVDWQRPLLPILCGKAWSCVRVCFPIGPIRRCRCHYSVQRKRFAASWRLCCPL